MVRPCVVVLAVLCAASIARADDAAPFEIETGRGPTGLAFEVPLAAASDWKRPVRIVVADTASHESKDLKLLDAGLEDAAGDVAIVSAPGFGPAGPLAPGAALPATLTAKFPRAGVYKGELVLAQGAARRVVPIAVTVAAPTQQVPIALHGGNSVLVTGGERAVISLSIERTAPVPALRATVVGVAAVDKLPSPTIARIVPAPGGTVDVPPDGRVSLAIPADDPGVYDVETELSDPSNTFLPQIVHTTIYRSSSWLWAVLWIGLGAIVAAIIRYWLDGGRTKLELLTRIATLRVQVDDTRRGYRADALIDAASGLAGSVAALDTQVRAGGDKAALALAITRAEQRYALLQAVAAALPAVQRLTGAPGKQAQGAVDIALAAVRSDLAADALQAAITAFQAIDLDAAYRDQVAAGISTLQKQLDAYPPNADATLPTALDPARDALSSASAAIDRGETDTANTALRRAQSVVLVAFRDELRRLVNVDAPLTGVTPAQWTAMRSMVLAKLAVRDLGLDALQAAQATYTETALDGLIAYASKITVADEEKARVATIIAVLTAAKADPLAAAVSYGSLRGELEDIAARGARPLLISRSTTVAEILEAAPPAARTSVASLLPSLRFGTPAIRFAPSRITAPDALKLATGATTFFVNFVVLAIGVCTGMKSLYDGNPAWGGASACLTAFLWGAGVQVAGNVALGLRALSAKIGAPA